MPSSSLYRRLAPVALVVGCVFLLSAFASVNASTTLTKNVKATLKTSWQGFPLAMEASEFFAAESEDEYWKYLEEIGVVPSNTEEAEYNHLVAAAERRLNSDQKLGLLKLALAINFYNPRMQMFAHVAENTFSAATSSNSSVCPAWVLFGGKAFCSVDELASSISQARGSEVEHELLEFDHIFRSPSENARTAILYAEPGTSQFKAFHDALVAHASSGTVKYVLRPYTTNRREPAAVQGYGVELAIKNLEYKVMDTPIHTETTSDDMMVVSDDDSEEDVQGFLFSTLVRRYPDLAAKLNGLKESLLSGDDAVDNLSKWQFRDLGLQAAQHIIDTEDPLRALRDVSQNLPSVAPLLSKLKKDSAVHQQLSQNADRVGDKVNLVLLNGKPLDADADVFALFSKLRDQVSKYEALRRLDIARASVFDLLALPSPQRISPRIQLNSDSVFWLNNLEKDSMYRGWPSSVRDILRQTFPGQLHFISKNLFNLLCVVDVMDSDNVEWINTMIALIYRSQAPLRMGFLPLIKDSIREVSSSEAEAQPVSLAIAKVIMHFLKEHSIQSATAFLQRFGQQPRVTSMDRLREVFDASSGRDWSEVIGNRFNSDLRSVQSLLEDTGIMSPIVMLNGFVIDVPSAAQFTNQVANEIFRQRREIQEWVHAGRITDSMDIFDWLLQQDGFPSYNPAIFPSTQAPERYVPLASPAVRDFLKSATYITSPGTEDSVKQLTHLLLVDTEKPDHIKILQDMMQHTSEGSNTRFAIFPCDSSSNKLIPRTASALAQAQTASQVSQTLNKKASEIMQALLESWSEITHSKSSVTDFVKARADDTIDIAKFESSLTSPETDQQMDRMKAFCKKFKSQTAQFAFVTNGRLLESKKPFTQTEIGVIESYETKSRLQNVFDAISSISFDGIDASSLNSEAMSDFIQLVSSAVAQDSSSASTSNLSIDPDLHISFESRNLDSAISIVAYLDPLSAVSQRISSVLMLLREYLDPDTRIVLAPRLSVSDLPLKNFFRMKLDPISFDASGKRTTSQSHVIFSGLPQRKVLTMNMHPPAPWLVEAKSCTYDLDNILLAQLPPHESSLSVTFELNHILVEGSCADETNGGVPPRGLQLNLGDFSQPHRVDTLVMSNLGYFQLKAAPGVWTLKLAEGRASDIYRIISPSGFKSIVIADWIPSSHQLNVEKRPEMINEPLFPENEQDEESLFQGVLGGIFGKKSSTKDAGDTIHVFSLASGHLYERFLKIMMLSVVKKTDRPVKFWLLKNFLSPAFKEFVPRIPFTDFRDINMARAHNFSVELVTYKWPAWLWPQTEKQRIIWGYKILFLDVLFPLGLKKVIYVDADQVVRTDLKELWEMDLKGAPYGYTPFCSGEMANPDTKGFRFWDQGFWQDHLRGKPYHISALYVVDLVRFRAIAAGDRLRATYDSLARDPNSLANLDQDLPNYMQHFVPIFSLPREWLWCETWCNGDSKPAAKTIDLCNNPLTKTPKLEAAVKILPEWTGLDSEVKAVEKAYAQATSTAKTMAR